MVLYLDFGINLSLFGSLSSSVLQSTDCEITVHLRSMSETLPLYNGADADSAARTEVKGSS